MDDLSGLDWNTAPSSSGSGKNHTQYPSPLSQAPPAVSSRQQTPTLGLQLETALRSKNSGSNGNLTSKPDTFANLLAPQPTKFHQTPISMQERQRQLQAEKARQNGNIYQATDNSFWEGLGSGRGTPASVG